MAAKRAPRDYKAERARQNAYYRSLGFTSRDDYFKARRATASQGAARGSIRLPSAASSEALALARAPFGPISRRQFDGYLRADIDWSLENEERMRFWRGKHGGATQNVALAQRVQFFDVDRASSGITTDSVGYVVSYWYANVNPATNLDSLKRKRTVDGIVINDREMRNGKRRTNRYQKEFLTKWSGRSDDKRRFSEPLMELDEFEQRYGTN